ncbi:MAG: bile acid:sodium symporter family protein, partial [Vicinamibacterales bacterium]
SNLGLIALIALQVVVNFASVISVVGTRAILAGVLFIAGGGVIGQLLGGPAADTRRVLGLGTAQRNIAAALVVGSQSFTDPTVVVMVVVIAVVSLVTLMPLSQWLSKRT